MQMYLKVLSFADHIDQQNCVWYAVSMLGVFCWIFVCVFLRPKYCTVVVYWSLMHEHVHVYNVSRYRTL